MIGGNNTGSGHVVSYLYGDAQSMSGTAHGGNDQLISGTGTDHMWGDAASLSRSSHGGHDTFVFDDGFGTDFVYDFHKGEDKIEFTVTGITNLSNVSISTSGADTVITTSASATDIVTLVGYDNHAHPLTASDFLFA